MIFKKKILIDLDGVLNLYEGNYDKNYIPPIKNGAYEFIKELSKDYKIVIFTSRNLLQVGKWILENKLEEFIENITNVKEPCFLIIDDRCISFDGNFEVLKNKISDFHAWYDK